MLRPKSICTALFLGYIDDRRLTDVRIWKSRRPVTYMLYLRAKCEMAVEDGVSASNGSTCRHFGLLTLFRRRDGNGPQIFVQNVLRHTWYLRCGRLFKTDDWSKLLSCTCEMNPFYCLCQCVVSRWCRDEITVMAMPDCKIMIVTS